MDALLEGPHMQSDIEGGMNAARFNTAAARCGGAGGASSGDGTFSACMCTTSSKAAKDTRLAGVTGECSDALRPIELDLRRQPVLRCDSSLGSMSETVPKANETFFTEDLVKFSGVLRPKVLGVGT